nr:PREDICTED: gastrokine-1-like [Latimeria chalumnae]|eukprot:XP_006014496.1 PREDICTED: gastrokine-1-like [Latimeria chalumnae]
MNKAKIPSLEEMRNLAHDAKDKKQTAPPRGMQYTVSKTPVKNQANLGKNIDMLCRGVPTYWAHEIEGASLFVREGCISVGLIIIDISLCGAIWDF